MIRGKDHAFAIPQSTCKFWMAALGNTTNAPTIPADGTFRPTTSTYPRRCNGISLASGEAPSRSSQGIFVLTYRHQVPTVMFATAAVLSAGNSPTAVLVADVTIIDPVARQVTVKITTPTGTLTDPGTSDMIVVQLECQDSGV